MIINDSLRGHLSQYHDVFFKDNSACRNYPHPELRVYSDFLHYKAVQLAINLSAINKSSIIEHAAKPHKLNYWFNKKQLSNYKWTRPHYVYQDIVYECINM